MDTRNKVMTAYVKPAADITAGELRLHVSKMNRLFFISENKTFSVSFPFTTQFTDGYFSFSSPFCSDVNSRVSSEILSLILKHNVLAFEDIYSFFDPISAAVEIDGSVWSLLKHLMVCDDGYIRFDHDVERENGKLHPRNHVDIFYSGATTFKIGLSQRLSIAEFTDLLDVNTDCHFLTKV